MVETDRGHLLVALVLGLAGMLLHGDRGRQQAADRPCRHGAARLRHTGDLRIRPQTAPYDSWKSPITSSRIAEQSIGLAEPLIDGDGICWLEQRPKKEPLPDRAMVGY
jgi:hypothetical protein